MTGIEPAEGWLQQAAERERTEQLGIAYIQQDLSTLYLPGEDFAPFDAVVANMVFMDIPDDEAAVRNCVAALRPGGSLIFSFAHPCFEEDSARWGEQGYVAMREYLAEYVVPQTFSPRFHRPLSHYLNAVAQTGCGLREVVEPQLGAEWVEQGPWHARNTHVPSFIVIHATRKAAGGSRFQLGGECGTGAAGGLCLANTTYMDSDTARCTWYS